MSPLVRSLLALAALFATAVTLDPPPPNCNQNPSFGNETTYLYSWPTSDFHPPTNLTIKGDNCPNDTHHKGELVLICNLNEKGQAPVVTEAHTGDFEHLVVECPDACPEGVNSSIWVYCG